MFNNLFICLFFLFPLPSLYAQELDTLSGAHTQAMANTRPLFMIVKWAPLSLRDLDNTLQIGVEYPFTPTLSIQQEVGYGWFNFNNNKDIHGNEYKKREVWRSRSELRFYFEDKNIKKPTGTYIALEIVYKRVNYQRERAIGRECENSPCQYYQIVNYKILKDVLGLHGKVGWQFLLKDRFVVDLYLGGGVRNVWVKSPSLASDATTLENRFVYLVASPTQPGSYLLASMSTGFKLGYIFYK